MRVARLAPWRGTDRGSILTYGVSVGAVALASGICQLMVGRLDLANIIMVYLAAVAVVASQFGLGESVLASVLSVAVFDVAFVEPKGTFAVAAPHHVVTFVVMLGVALLISGLNLRVRRQARASLERERMAEALSGLSRVLLGETDERAMAGATAKATREVFDLEVAVSLAQEGRLRALVAPSDEVAVGELGTLCWQENRVVEGPKGRGLYLPIRGMGGAIGIMAAAPSGRPAPEQVDLLQIFANTLGLAIERIRFARQSQEARVIAEGERIRNSLLRSISHDLRTPLTAIAGAASSLKLGQGEPGQLASTIYDQALRMNLQVQNLLDMTRLQSGSVRPALEWHVVEEIVGSAIASASDLLRPMAVRVELPEGMPMLEIDASLVEKVFVNLLENVAAHATRATKVVVTADLMSSVVRINVADDGPGIPRGEEAWIFEQFAQRRSPGGSEGFGLGLAIARAIMKLHGGRIWAENAAASGAVFHLEFPKPTSQPEVPVG